MTNKQTIDGVSRETIQSALNAVEYLALRADDIGASNIPLADELRAILDKPPTDWEPCSPALLESGVDCATAPRWSSKEWGGHSHWHPADQHQSGIERAVSLAMSREMRVYIAGPMTGLPEFNFPAFNAMAEEMRAAGWHVENPAEHGHVEGAEWADYLRYDIGRLATCEAIMLLPGWSKSRGARLEFSIAKELGVVFMFAEGAEREPAGQQQVEPVGWQFYQHGKWQNGFETNNHRANTEAAGIPVREVYAKQPAPVAVVLPEHLDTRHMDGYQSPYDSGYNACLDEVAKLNGIKP